MHDICACLGLSRDRRSALAVRDDLETVDALKVVHIRSDDRQTMTQAGTGYPEIIASDQLSALSELPGDASIQKRSCFIHRKQGVRIRHRLEGGMAFSGEAFGILAEGHDGQVEFRAVVRQKEAMRGPVGMRHSLSLEIDEERGVDTQPESHGSSGGWSFFWAASRRSISSWPRGVASSMAASKAPALCRSSVHRARLITFEKDSLGVVRAALSRSYASMSMEMVFVATMHVYIHAYIQSSQEGSASIPTAMFGQ